MTILYLDVTDKDFENLTFVIPNLSPFIAHQYTSFVQNRPHLLKLRAFYHNLLEISPTLPDIYTKIREDAAQKVGTY